MSINELINNVKKFVERIYVKKTFDQAEVLVVITTCRLLFEVFLVKIFLSLKKSYGKWRIQRN